MAATERMWAGSLSLLDLPLMSEDEFSQSDKDKVFSILSEQQKQLMDLICFDHASSLEDFQKYSKYKIISKIVIIFISLLVTIFGILGQTNLNEYCINFQLISTILSAILVSTSAIDAFLSFSQKRNGVYAKYLSLGKLRNFYALRWAIYVSAITDISFAKYQNAVMIINNMSEDYFNISDKFANMNIGDDPETPAKAPSA